jgi:gliding motility-associated-like protein
VRNTLFYLLFFIVMCQSAKAMHIIGGDLTYEFVSEVSPGVHRYQFVLTMYRDCNSGGAEFDNNASIGIYRGNSSSATPFADFLVARGGVEPIPTDTPECVTSIPSICVERGFYTFTRDLPVSNASYFVVYQRCCRNVTIKNLIDPGDIGATFSVEINPQAQLLKNSSPVFNNFPRTVICNNLPLIEDQSATDKDGDQLVYSFCSPFAGGGPILQGPAANSCQGAVPIPSCGPPFDFVPFITPTYTPQAPMGGSPVIGINANTGLISGIPNQLGQFVVGVCVTEIRNGQPIGSIRRDFQFNLADCSPDLFADLTADTSIAPQVYIINSCGPKDVFVKNKSTKLTNIDDVLWVVDIKGTPFTSTDFDLTVSFPDTGSYPAKLYLNPGQFCTDSAEVLINVFPPIFADFSYVYDTCVAGPVSFTDLSSGIGQIDKWYWQFGTSAEVSQEISPDFLYTSPGVKDATLTVVDTNGCFATVVKPIQWLPAPPYIIIQPDDYSGCIPADILFTNLSSPIDSTYFITWDFGDGTRDTGVISPRHTYTESGLYSVSVYIRSPIGCEVSADFSNLVRVSPSPIANFDMNPSGGFTPTNNTVQFTDQSIDASYWGWQFGTNGSSILQNPSYTFVDTGLQQVLLVATHALGCKDTISKLLDFVPTANWTMPNSFTPNGDSYNEVFFGNGNIEYAKAFQMTIWNRWGELVFQTTNPREGWNGTIMNLGTPCTDGIYVYVVNYQGPRSENIELKGYVNLLR